LLHDIQGQYFHDKLALLDYWVLAKRIACGSIIRLRHYAHGMPALVRYDSLPQSWQDLLVRKLSE
jgi:hypothetical protein